MRLTRIILVLVFLAVAVVYTFQGAMGRNAAAEVPPVLSCDTEILELSVRDGSDALLTGVTATDEQDGDLTDRVLVSGVSRLIEDNTAKITYVVFDSDDNMATLTRQLRYTDYQLPRFSLDAPLVYGADQSISLLDRLHAQDVLDGDISHAIRAAYIYGAADTGVHTINVQVTNSMGDTAWLALPVIITADLDDRVDVTLDTYLLYLQQGGSFSPREHLKSASYRGAAVSLDNVTVTGDVDPNTPGTYNVEYTGTYGSHTGTVILTVVVE